MIVRAIGATRSGVVVYSRGIHGTRDNDLARRAIKAG